MKMPTIVGIFKFISRENFMLSWIEHENFFIASGPKLTVDSGQNSHNLVSSQVYAFQQRNRMVLFKF